MPSLFQIITIIVIVMNNTYKMNIELQLTNYKIAISPQGSPWIRTTPGELSDHPLPSRRMEAQNGTGVSHVGHKDPAGNMGI